MTSYDKILAAMESRYDHQSARIIVAEALDKAGLADKKRLEPKEIQAVIKALSEVGDGIEEALESIRESGAASPRKVAEKPKAPPKKAPAAKKKK